MKVYYIGILRNEIEEPVQLSVQYELSGVNRFARSSAAELMAMFAGRLAQATKPGQRQEVTQESYKLHSFARVEGICGILISDQEYDKMVAQSILSKVCDEFVSKYPRSAYKDATKDSLPKNQTSVNLPYPELEGYIQKYQDPNNADSIMKIQKELDEAKIILHKTIEGVLERGEKIDSLVAKSDDLSAQSKMFYTQAKKQNSCCVVM